MKSKVIVQSKNPRPMAPASAMYWVCLFALLLAAANCLLAQPTPPEPPPTATAAILSVQGTVEVAKASSGQWTPAKTGQTLLTRDRVRAGHDARALIRLADLSLFRVKAGSELEILPPERPSGKVGLDLKRGAGYFFGRDRPREIHLRTPLATGAIRGTEFHVAVAADGRTVLTLLDGEVELSNAHGTALLTTGEQGIVEPGGAPRKTSVIEAINIIQWCLYYPGVLDARELPFTPEEKAALAESLEAYREGALLAALDSYPVDHAPASPSGRVYRAALLLSVGQVTEAEAELDAVQSSEELPARLAGALRTVIAAVKLDEHSPAPLSTSPSRPILAGEWLAESYHHQSRFQLSEALEAARAATDVSPEFGFAWARVAELEFSFGRIESAIQTVNRALELSPRNAQAVTLNGFLLAARQRHSEALAEMERAIGLDSALGNAWLGRGLLRIQRGDLAGGRGDLQAAAALEPQRALLRSYLAKAFFHEGNFALAAREIKLAQRLDPNDPTAWLYSSLLHFQRNRVNEAVRDLEHSRDLNDNRRVFRSRLLLDQDRAVRGANLAAIYHDAGMTEVSRREASRAVQDDYANFSAHAFLADSYNALRDPNLVNLRYETPWFTEYLMANLLAPVGGTSLSQSMSQQEYARLFEGGRFGMFSLTEYASRGAWQQAGSAYGSEGRLGYALDAFYLTDPGFRPNNDLEVRTLSGQVKLQLTARDSLFFHAIHAETLSGDVAQYYDQRSAQAELRTREQQEPNLLAGYHREWQPGSHTLLLASRFDSRTEFNNPSHPALVLGRDGANHVIFAATAPTALEYRGDIEIYSTELQQIWQPGRHGFIVGGRYQSGRFDTHTAFPATPIPPQAESTDFDRASLYGYHFWRICEPLQLTAGLAYDHLRYPENFNAPPVSEREAIRRQVSPKAGFIYTPDEATTVRFAYTRSLGGVSLDQSVRLEPAQIAGFLQTYRSLTPESVEGSPPAARFETFGLGVDRRFNRGTYIGIETELLHSDVERTIGAFDVFPPPATPSSTPLALDFAERTLLIHASQLLGDHWSLGARYQLSNAELDSRFREIPVSASPAAMMHHEATLHQLRFYGAFHHRSGFFALAEGLWNSQDNRGYDPRIPGDAFWHANLFAGYRFPRRHAELRLGLLNVTGRDYNLNPLNLHHELPRERTFTASLKMQF